MHRSMADCCQSALPRSISLPQKALAPTPATRTASSMFRCDRRAAMASSCIACEFSQAEQPITAPTIVSTPVY
jgi:hypothetical protein